MRVKKLNIVAVAAKVFFVLQGEVALKGEVLVRRSVNLGAVANLIPLIGGVLVKAKVVRKVKTILCTARCIPRFNVKCKV